MDAENSTEPNGQHLIHNHGAMSHFRSIGTHSNLLESKSA